MKDITQLIDIKTDENESCFVDPVKSLSLERSKQMLFSSGGNLSTDQGKKESIVPSFATKVRSDRAILFAKRTRSLITGGLVRGIIPMSMRRQLGQQTLDTAFLQQDGDDAALQKVD